MEQLRKALKVAEACVGVDPANLTILVQILNTYIYYYQMDSGIVQASDVSDLFSFIKEIADEIEDKKKASEGLKFL